MAGKLDLLRRWLSEVSGNEIQVILVHDYKDQETHEELLEIASTSKCKNLELVNVRANSPGAARNEGISRSKNTWITFWDSDDLPMVANVGNSIATSTKDIEIIIGCFEKVDIGSGERTRVPFSSEPLFSIGLNPGLWRMVFRRNIIESQKFSNSLMGEDQDFISRIDLPSRKILYTNELFYNYYIGRTGQLTATQRAIDKVYRNSKAMYRIGKKSNSSNFEFVLVMVLRQIFTGIGHGSFPIRLKSISFLFAILLFGKNSTKRVFLKTIRAILRGQYE